MDLNQAVAVVTGSASGIGRALAARLSQEGAVVEDFGAALDAGFGDEIEIEPSAGGLIIKPAARGLSFQEAKAKLLTEKRALLARLSDA